MKKYILLLVIFLLAGCTNKEKSNDTKILSKGELICVYKENRINENLTYSSYY